MTNSMLNNLIFDPAYLIIGCIVLIAVLLILVIVMMNKHKKLARKYDLFMRGSDAETLEGRFEQAVTDIIKLEDENKKNKNKILANKKSLEVTFQKMGLVKYDSLAGMGGKSSFALALLSRENDGFILNIIHSREGSYPYIKRIEKGIPETSLGTEEQLAFNEALEKK